MSKNEKIITVDGQEIGLLMTAYVYEAIDDDYEGGMQAFVNDERGNARMMKRGYALLQAMANNYARKHPEQKPLTMEDIRDWPYDETFSAINAAMSFFRGGHGHKDAE